MIKSLYRSSKISPLQTISPKLKNTCKSPKSIDLKVVVHNKIFSVKETEKHKNYLFLNKIHNLHWVSTIYLFATSARGRWGCHVCKVYLP